MLYADLNNKSFTIVCDKSEYKLGYRILQDGSVLVVYWSKFLSPAQKNYTTIEKELLAIISILKEYFRILLGGKLAIYTDHKT